MTKPIYKCPKCKKIRNIPEGKVPLTSICSDCLKDIELELAMRNNGPLKSKKKTN